MVLAKGDPLDRQGVEDAVLMGVHNPERVRVLLVDRIPGPNNRLLAKAAQIAGIYNPSVRGISYRYGIMIRRDCFPSRELVAHECAHTAQYERLGGISPFLRDYLRECLIIGYPGGPLEQEAIENAGRLTS